MKQLFFKAKIKTKRLVADIILLYQMKKQVRLYVTNNYKQCGVHKGLFYAAYACDMYKHKKINLWQTILSLKSHTLNKNVKIIYDTIREAYRDGFIFEDEYTSAIHSVKHLFLLAKKYLFIYKLM